MELFDLKGKHSRASTREFDKENRNKENQILALDYNVDGTQWASGGADRTVRVYDEERPKEPKRELRGDAQNRGGHSNRICSVCFMPDKPTCLFSAGLDNTVLMWDTRDQKPVALIKIPEVEIAGDALDVKGTHTLLTGSWRPERQVSSRPRPLLR